jgi:hypothetical protein
MWALASLTDLIHILYFSTSVPSFWSCTLHWSISIDSVWPDHSETTCLGS